MNCFVIGDVTVDHLYHLDRIPAAGEELSPRQASMQPGGSGGTVSVTLARLGHHVTLAACVGDDPFAEFALQTAQASGVDLSAVQRDSVNLTSTITVMQTPDGRRAMISHGAANRRLDPGDFAETQLRAAQALVVSAYTFIRDPQRAYALRAMDLAEELRIPVFIDLGTGAVNAVGSALLDHVLRADHLLLNQHELQALTDRPSISEALAFLGERGSKQVVVKVGANGSIVWTPEHTELVDPVDTGEQVLDSTGAGDTFVGAYVHAVLSGQDAPAAARAGNAAGILSASRLGAQSREITADMLQAALR